MKEIQATLLADSKCVLGEGPVYDETCHGLYWTDITTGRLHFMDLETGEHNYLHIGRNLGCFALTDKGRIVAGLNDGIYILDGPRCIPYCKPAEGLRPPDTRYNDGKCDPFGRFVLGTSVEPNDSEKGCLVSVDGRDSYQVLCDGLGCSNGLAWSLDGKTMYHVDTLDFSPSVISAFDYDPATGAASNRRQAVDFTEKAKSGILPDGMAIDENGNLWIAEWGNYCVACYDPRTGEQIARISLPVEHVTCCTFGGKNFDKLYITTASISGEPGGGVYVAEPGVHGFPTTRFKET
ncbi:MAG: SMP-30/gluconolactonase/LRE family protein [Ruminococcaceae bacterium]|nr:SMP-30/gluconolactonase/LRE family protein [Oscillospiraceae bacterium]MBE6995887.1 SMP-30/gluconolactonase/LRE family protein [Oscillospiraceae bacterium]